MAAHHQHAHSPWRANVEALTMAIIMALLLKYFIVEAYKIPTGSMQPTLIGDEQAQVFDRILVNKLAYTLRDPERWEVVVFRYPLDRSKNFVKRIAGVGPEELKIERGDIWRRGDGSEPWKILRRPRSVQRAIWKQLVSDEPDEPSWVAADSSPGWSFEGRSIEARGDGRASFGSARRRIFDDYLDGYPDSLRDLVATPRAPQPQNDVGDLRVDGEITALEGTRSVTIELEEGALRHRLRIPGPAAREDARPEIITLSRGPRGSGLVSRRPAESAFRLPAGRRVRLGAQNMDDLIELEVDGQALLALEIESVRDQRSGVSIEVEGEGADLVDLMVYRDIYYTPGPEQVIRIPAGEYLMLGDNTQDSSDGRSWRLARYAFEGEGAEESGRRILRGDLRKGENPLRIPGYVDGHQMRFRDEWGELHWFMAEDARLLSPTAASFVPRDMIQGHAIAVFWPMSPMRGIWRLKWVN